MNAAGSGPQGPGGPRPSQVLDRRSTPSGELVLRRSSDGFELVSDGRFAMSSHLDGHSERFQVERTLRAVPGARDLLIGGLGLGLGVARAVADPTLRTIVVAEVEATVIDWHGSFLRELTGAALEDPRVEVVQGDVGDVIASDDRPMDAIVLDVDNGPSWLLRPDNARLYRPGFLRICADRLPARGALSVWSAGAEPLLVRALRRCFTLVEIELVAVPRGEPDRIHVASRPV